MQQTGTLRKRKKRSLSKVTGLGTVPYTDAGDWFDGKNLYSLFNLNSSLQNYSSPQRLSPKTQNHFDTRIPINPTASIASSYQFKSKDISKWKRVTRNPNFHHIALDMDGSSATITTAEVSQFTPISPQNPPNELKGRSHFLDKSTMSRLKQLLLLGATSGSYPWVWNEKEHRIDKWSPFLQRIWAFQWYPWFIQTAFLTVFQFYAFFHKWTSSEGKTHRQLFMGFFSVAWYCAATYSTVNLYYHMEQIREYINTLLKFNKGYVDKYLLHLEGYKDGGRLVINGAIPSTIFQVFISVLFFVAMPFQHWFLFSYIYPKPWYWLIPGAIHQYTIYGHVIASYSLFTWLVTAHTNSVNFWLTETHNNHESDYTSEELRHPKIALETYRKLQVLCLLFNECMAPLAMLMIKMIMASALIPCSYVLIRSMNHYFFDEFPQILSYPLGITDCATAAFSVLSMAAEMYDLASGFIDSWSRTKHKDLRRLLMSFPCLSVKVRSFYFISVSTTITYFQTIFDFIIDCIMTFP